MAAPELAVEASFLSHPSDDLQEHNTHGPDVSWEAGA